MVVDFCCGLLPLFGETGSESVSNSLRVLPRVSGETRIKARSIRTQTCVVNLYNI